MNYTSLRSDLRDLRNQVVPTVIEDNWMSYLMFLPTALFITWVLWYQFANGIWISLHDWPLVGEPTWVGLRNYQQLFSWDVFWHSVKTTLIYSTVTLAQLGIALLAALLVHSLDQFKSIVSGIFLVPYAMPPITSGTIWYYLLAPQSGPAFQYLVDIGLLSEPIYWQKSGSAALGVIWFVSAWTFWPFIFLLLVAGLENIPDEHYEAAKIYGAGRVKRFLNVTLPELKSVILVAVSIRIIWNFAKVSQPFQLTEGGPGWSTSILGVLLYRLSLFQGNYGRGFAVGIIMFVMLVFAIALFIREYEKNDEVNV